MKLSIIATVKDHNGESMLAVARFEADLVWMPMDKAATITINEVPIRVCEIEIGDDDNSVRQVITNSYISHTRRR